MTTEAIGRKRLEKLATYLEETKFPKGKFHLAVWMGGYHRTISCIEDIKADPASNALFALKATVDLNDPAFKYMKNGGEVVPLDCKTVGCAVGWGIVGIPSFRRAGLHFTEAEDMDQNSVAQIGYKSEKAFDAVAAFFALSDHVVNGLFIQDSYKLADRSKPKAVAKRIRLYLAKGSDALDKVRRTA